MKLLKVKTVRFCRASSRKPAVLKAYTPWQKPAGDRHLQSQIKNNRVMTIQRSESGTEFGMVGFKQAEGASLSCFSEIA